MARILFADETILPIKELERQYKKETDKRFAERILSIIWSISEKITMKEIANRLRRDPQAIRKWIHAYNNNGIDDLKPVFKGGRKSKLNKKDEIFIIDLLDKNPKDFGYFDQVWDCNLLAAVFGKEHGVDLHRDVVWRMLGRRNFSFKRPESVHPKADPEIKKKQKKNFSPWKKE